MFQNVQHDTGKLAGSVAKDSKEREVSWQSRAFCCVPRRTLSTHLASLSPDREWIQFAARSDHLLDPDTPLIDLKLVSYPLKDNPSVFPVHTGHMKRKKRLTRAYGEFCSTRWVLA